MTKYQIVECLNCKCMTLTLSNPVCKTVGEAWELHFPWHCLTLTCSRHRIVLSRRSSSNSTSTVVVLVSSLQVSPVDRELTRDMAPAPHTSIRNRASMVNSHTSWIRDDTWRIDNRITDLESGFTFDDLSFQRVWHDGESAERFSVQTPFALRVKVYKDNSSWMPVKQYTKVL